MPDIMTLEQTAEYLHLHPVTLRNKARRGEIPATKLGRQWRFVKDQLDAWLRKTPEMPQDLEDWALIAIAEERMANPARRFRPFAEFVAELEQ
jgi:excisionase family DNA binding protein